MILHQCKAKYLGKARANAPKVGTLENTARIYQKGCLNIKDRDTLSVTLTTTDISIDDNHGFSCSFPLKHTLFCATFKKIPKVVAFNYLSSKDPATIDCHALYMDNTSNAMTFVQAMTRAFQQDYQLDSIQITKTLNKNNPWMSKIGSIWKSLVRDKTR